jgi:hypothetical protein
VWSLPLLLALAAAPNLAAAPDLTVRHPDGRHERLRVAQVGEQLLLGLADVASRPYRAWGVWVADLDADGGSEIVLGVYSPRRRHGAADTGRSAWVLRFERGRFVERWRGSGLGRPLVDLRVSPDPLGDLVLAAERRADGVCGVTIYRWVGFGLAALGGRVADCAAPFCGPHCVNTIKGPRRPHRAGSRLTWRQP